MALRKIGKTSAPKVKRPTSKSAAKPKKAKATKVATRPLTAYAKRTRASGRRQMVKEAGPGGSGFGFRKAQFKANFTQYKKR